MTELEKAAKLHIWNHPNNAMSYPEWDGADAYNAFVAGAEWQAKQSPWIRVEDRLPDTDNGQSLCEVLVKMNGGRCYVAANIDVERLAEIGEVTHWMPIPES